MRFHVFKNYHNDLTFVDIKCKAGDLYISQKNEYMLALGENLWGYDDQKLEYMDNINNSANIIIYMQSFLSTKTIQIIHILTREYFSEIGNVIKLYIHDIDNIIKHKPLIKKKLKSSQILYIFSDGRSIRNTTESILPDLDIITSYPSIVQQSKLFRKIKNGISKGLVCTHGIIFQDWQNLTEVYIYDSRRRYYKNQKDPRYETLQVAKIMSDIYGADFVIDNYISKKLEK